MFIKMIISSSLPQGYLKVTSRFKLKVHRRYIGGTSEAHQRYIRVTTSHPPMH